MLLKECSQGEAAEGNRDQQLKQMQSGAVQSDHARLVLARDTTAQSASE